MGRKLLISLWFSLLLLPFKGLASALISFLAFFAVLSGYPLLSNLFRGIPAVKLPRIGWRIFMIALLVLSALYPLAATGYYIDIAVLAGIYIILASGLNVVVGYTGLLHLGYVAFYAIGAYAYAILSVRLGLGFWAALPASTLLATVAGGLLAFPALRLRGDYLAIVTLGFGEITRLVLNNWDGFTNGPNGISGIPRPSIAGHAFNSLAEFYYIVLSAAIVSVLIIRNVCNSKTGRAWVSIREDEVAASASGINTMKYKFYSLAFGSFWAGLAGALFASKMQFISPESFSFMESVLILCMVIIGGLGSIAGPVLGALILVGLPELLRGIDQFRMLVLGGGLVLLMVYRPQGLLGGRNVSS